MQTTNVNDLLGKREQNQWWVCPMTISGRRNNPPKPCAVLMDSSAIRQPKWCTSRGYPCDVRIMPTIGATHSDGGSDGNNFAVVEQEKNYHVDI